MSRLKGCINHDEAEPSRELPAWAIAEAGCLENAQSHGTHTFPSRGGDEDLRPLRERDLTIIQTANHPDIVDDFVAIGVFRGVDAVRGLFAELFGAFPDFDLEVVNKVGDAEHAVVQWHATGTFTGSAFQGIHATGRRVDLLGCDVMRFEEGRLKHNTIYYDGLGFARQIGLLPKAGSGADKAITAAFNAGTDVRVQIRQRVKSASQ